jgi:carbon storage regulator CsrA
MLILTRRIGETLRIGHDVSVKDPVDPRQSGSPGIQAPKSVSVHREEVFNRIAEEGKRRGAVPIVGG